MDTDDLSLININDFYDKKLDISISVGSPLVSIKTKIQSFISEPVLETEL